VILDAKNAELLVYSFKEGVLSAMAHDLKLRVESFRIDVKEQGAVDASFDPRSLRVVCARKDGVDTPHALPHVLFGEVESNIEKKVLKPKRFSSITFTAARSDDSGAVGTLTLCGVSREVRVARAREKNERGHEVFVCRARVDQREFGIEPFSAAFGTLKVKPHVEIELRVPASVVSPT
jgi:YceI-like domain